MSRTLMQYCHKDLYSYTYISDWLKSFKTLYILAVQEIKKQNLMQY